MRGHPLDKSPYAPYWWKLERRACADMAINGYALDPVFRVWLLALGRAEQGGHAQFAPGEIRELLTTVDKRTGTLVQKNQRTVQRWVRDLTKAGMAAPESNVACIALPYPMLASTVRPNLVPCQVHGHNLSWTDAGWIDPDLSPEESAKAVKRLASAHNQK
jgi:hypothetical protein